MKNIFITGASSFLGENLLLNLKDHNIFALEKKTKINPAENIKIIKSLPEDLNLFFNEFDINYVIHLATKSSRNYEKEEVENMVETNILLGFKILNASLNSPIKKVISAGTYSQDVIPRPINIYTLSKQYFEDIQKYFSKNYQLENTSIHFGDIYGPNDNRNKLIPYLKNNENQKEIEFESDGKGYLSPVFVNDATESIVYELSKKNNPLFSVKTVASDLMSVEDFVYRYKEERNKGFEVIFKGKVKPKYEEVVNFKPSKKLKWDLKKGLSLI